ncbi:hypothetical protein [Amycolatopsis sp. WQ 127309]|uniref:hypothetical protein n=1 Tax=Amycolatopsis sp. WQ 127309 TaxID=2932773 RepID=UPI001FF3DE56|nr:hypothetical protein [Amycolatopsis sp. WQ 127309]UOZ08829.1 hypothetical protein MUY22_11350 [Amycolatopsis sp. WQ 127309]
MDLLVTSALLRSHAESGKIVLGVNHAMTDYATGRKKALDLVIARPDHAVPPETKTFAGLAKQFGISLTPAEQAALDGLPQLQVAPVSSVLVALEAKACMTEHVKALPRLYDELNSAHLCIHGSSKQALAIGYVQLNAASEFISPGRNQYRLSEERVNVTKHRQPAVTERVLDKVREIPRRSASSETGYDGLGVTVLDLRNDGSPVGLVEDPPAPQPGGAFHYAGMITRMATEYDATFARI